MATLVENGKVLDEKLAESKGKLNKLKSEFVIWTNFVILILFRILFF